MKYKLVKLLNLSGNAASIYSIEVDDLGKTLFDVFLGENRISFKNELSDILQRIKTIGNITGAREQFFKLNEGNPGDGVCALYDARDKHLRLYCIRYGTQLVILGGGGPKPKGMKALQNDEKLRSENYVLRKLSKAITGRMQESEIMYTRDHLDFEGNLEFNNEEDE